ITPRTAADTCTASATFTLSQSSPAAYLSGPYKMIRTCDGKTDTVQTSIKYGALTSDRTVGLTLNDSKDTVLNLRKPDTVVVKDTVVAGKKDTTISTQDTVALAAHALQNATPTGTATTASALGLRCHQQAGAAQSRAASVAAPRRPAGMLRTGVTDALSRQPTMKRGLLRPSLSQATFDPRFPGSRRPT